MTIFAKALTESVIGSGFIRGPVLSPGGANAYAAFLLADDFDNSKYWQTDDNTGAGGATYSAPSSLAGYSFTASGECYELNSDGTIAGPFAANVPAITDEGFKARQSLTNNYLQSQTLNTSPNGAAGAVITADALAAPDGTTTADQLATDTSGTSGSAQIFHNPITFSGSGKKTASVFVKAGTIGWLRFELSGYSFTGVGAASATCYFDASNGAVGTASNCTGYVVGCGDGWYRCVMIIDLDGADLSGIGRIYLAEADGDITFATRDGSQYLYLWQAQALGAELRDGGPIIVTTTAAATRGEALLTHNLFADGSALTDQDMLIWAKGTPGEIGADQRVLDIRVDNSNRLHLYIGITGLVSAQVISGGSAVYSVAVAGTISANADATFLLRREGGNWRVGKYVGGMLTWGTESAAAFPTGMTKVTPGNGLTGTVPMRGTIDSAFIQPGTFDTDQKVIAAITEAP